MFECRHQESTRDKRDWTAYPHTVAPYPKSQRYLAAPYSTILGAYLFGVGVHSFRHLKVVLGQALTVVRGQRDVDLVVDVEPFRVMIHLWATDRQRSGNNKGVRE